MARSREKPTAKKPPAARFVLDCSVVFAWFFADESDAYADAIADSLKVSAAVVPSLWPLEVANAIVIGERRNRCTQAQATEFLSRLATLPIAIDDQTARVAWSDALPIARSQKLSAYDAAYLELAIREGIPLATLDDRLRATAAVLGVAQHQP
jgi:predicted nucleic acid-binding protein